MNPVPELVTLHVWRLPRRAVPRALIRMAVDRRRLRATPGVAFAKLLGTGTGSGFGPTDADLTRWAALVVWADPARAAGFDDSPVGRAWGRIATSCARLDLRPLASRGRWAGAEPFGNPTTRSGSVDGPVLALTRARLRPARAATFWRAIPAVAAALPDTPGLTARFGIGEAPLGWQGTVSVWRSSADLLAFAYRQPEHQNAIMRTPTERWYAEELFARFEVRAVRGDRTVLDWTGHDGGPT
ncbi:monooxygenase [Micromonospora sp. NBC_01796]|uniref:monooxygenase n=1 Tax=Micromonospora sp. NBC_01796 TaxID=2975987 RepID=UPI002DDBC2DE|nr:monooxygenase [Micromonospora sp. NBC_01796]WSA83414.1 monooxygenase [Micromonospora sp. NBC_01796]